MSHHSVDIQWGNHDISWMGAAAGNQALICNVIRISAKYGNLNLLDDVADLYLLVRGEEQFCQRILGDDMVLGNSFADGTYQMLVEIGPLSARRMESFFPGAADSKILNALTELFLLS